MRTPSPAPSRGGGGLAAAAGRPRPKAECLLRKVYQCLRAVAAPVTSVGSNSKPSVVTAQQSSDTKIEGGWWCFTRLGLYQVDEEFQVLRPDLVKKKVTWPIF